MRSDSVFVLGLAGALYAFLILGILQATQRHNVRLWHTNREGITAVYGFIEERLNGREDTLANGGVPYVMRRLAQLQGVAYRTFHRALLFSVFTFSVTHLLFVLATALGLGIGIWLYQQGQITIGTVYLIRDDGLLGLIRRAAARLPHRRGQR